MKSKGEKERYKHLNAEFQRIARRDKGFFCDQYKEIEESNRMGKTRDLFKKIRDNKGIFYTKMGSIKDRNKGNKIGTLFITTTIQHPTGNCSKCKVVIKRDKNAS